MKRTCALNSFSAFDCAFLSLSPGNGSQHSHCRRFWNAVLSAVCGRDPSTQGGGTKPCFIKLPCTCASNMCNVVFTTHSTACLFPRNESWCFSGKRYISVVQVYGYHYWCGAVAVQSSIRVSKAIQIALLGTSGSEKDNIHLSESHLQFGICLVGVWRYFQYV